ncbi:hypothetical protein GGR56DRAFT_688083 [Xylariaceae sp. FL0804]|nr:hypothetical protein GGR56DRAFT_688083 [Xylariaceae sp. FL0804]
MVYLAAHYRLHCVPFRDIFCVPKPEHHHHRLWERKKKTRKPIMHSRLIEGTGYALVGGSMLAILHLLQTAADAGWDAALNWCAVGLVAASRLCLALDAARGAQPQRRRLATNYVVWRWGWTDGMRFLSFACAELVLMVFVYEYGILPLCDIPPRPSPPRHRRRRGRLLSHRLRLRPRRARF